MVRAFKTRTAIGAQKLAPVGDSCQTPIVSDYGAETFSFERVEDDLDDYEIVDENDMVDEARPDAPKRPTLKGELAVEYYRIFGGEGSSSEDDSWDDDWD